MSAPAPHESCDLLVIGGGINGAGIARDAAGRGLKVVLAEQGDLAGATSSASSKLIHGGLRYLEQHAFRLVRESLSERDVLLASAPHLIRPLRFVLPVTGGRPAWKLRLGLLLYDKLGWTPGRRSRIPRSGPVALAALPEHGGLKSGIERGFGYWDCWVDDARLVVLAALDAAARGAAIRVRTRVTGLARAADGWTATLDAAGVAGVVRARAVVNAAGPWADRVLGLARATNAPPRLRLVKGSHIVVPRLYPGDHALTLQNDDGRVVFTIPYEDRFTLIGTTDETVADPADPAISAAETAYLCRAAGRFLARAPAPADVAWSYAGIRPLYDDGASDASAVTRDYVLDLRAEGGAPILSVLGGKLTTFRRLAEHALERLAPFFPAARGAWTATAPLPGGDIQGAAFEPWLDAQMKSRPWLPVPYLRGLARRHGTRLAALLDGAAAPGDLGRHYGAGLYEREIDWLRREEWARTADDVLWRRTKFGLHLDAAARGAVAARMGG